jgi:hypothetical protein
MIFGHIMKTKIALVRQINEKYLLFGKALSDLFGILPEIGDRMNDNPV